MSHQIVSNVGSGLQRHRIAVPGSNNMPVDGVVVLNFEDQSYVTNVSGSVVTVPVDGTVRLPTNSIPFRREISIFNAGAAPISLGGWSGVGVGDGYILMPLTSVNYKLGSNLSLWAIASGVSSAARILEIS